MLAFAVWPASEAGNTSGNLNRKRGENHIKLRETKGTIMNLRKVLLVTAVSLMIVTSAASAQETLGDLVQQVGCDWIIGKWIGQSDEAGKYQIEYKWEIERHVMSIHFKGFDYEYHGIIYYKAEDEEVVQVGVDNRGGYGKGVWEAESGTARFRSEHTGEYGEISRTGFIYSKTDSDKMKTAVYKMDQYGVFDSEPEYTLEFKRQKEEPKKTETKVSTIEVKGTGTVAKLDVEVEPKAEKSTGK